MIWTMSISWISTLHNMQRITHINELNCSQHFFWIITFLDYEIKLRYFLIVILNICIMCALDMSYQFYDVLCTNCLNICPIYRINETQERTASSCIRIYSTRRWKINWIQRILVSLLLTVYFDWLSRRWSFCHKICIL